MLFPRNWNALPELPTQTSMAAATWKCGVMVDPVRLAARKLSILDIRQALLAENKNTSAGDIGEGKRRNVIRTLGRFDAAEDVAGVILAYRDGGPLYVRDVAEVRLAHAKSTGVGHQRGVRTLFLGVAREQGRERTDGHGRPG